MFRFLHKIYVSLGWLALAAVGGVLVYHRAMFYPLVDLVYALRTPAEGLEQHKCGGFSGPVTRVLSGDVSNVRGDRGQVYTIRLTGVEAPGFQLHNRAAEARAMASKTNLSERVLNREVRVELTYTNDSRHALGLVYLGPTNVNALAIETGIVQARPENMNGLPLKDRFALIQARRRAQERLHED